MYSGLPIFGRTTTRRAMAVLCCAAMLYFAAGGTILHQHTNGPDTACHICQALHMPALAGTPSELVAEPALVAWYSSRPLHVAPDNCFSLHRASRAPPSA
jgi:hypothetical protein